VCVRVLKIAESEHSALQVQLTQRFMCMDAAFGCMCVCVLGVCVLSVCLCASDC